MREHPGFDELYEYQNTDEITEENAEKMYSIDLHLAECTECLSKLRILNCIKVIVDNWTADYETKLYNIKADATIKDRVISWLEIYKGKADAAVEVFVNYKETYLGDENYVTKVVTSGMEQFINSFSRFNFNSALPQAARGRRGGKVYGTEARDENTGSIIAVDSSEDENNIIRVELKNIDDKKIPLIMMINVDNEEEAVLITEPEKSAASIYTAEFKHVRSGKYILMVEPLEN